MNACKTFPQCSKFWNVKMRWNIKTFPKCFNIFYAYRSFDRNMIMQELGVHTACPSRGLPVSLSRRENLHDY